MGIDTYNINVAPIR